MADSPSAILPCKECGYVNEPERVYCHQCGQKLDRSLLPKEDPAQRESVEKARRRIKRMTNPEAGNRVRRELGALARTLIFAAVAAAVVQAFRTPSGAPSERGELAERLVSTEMTEAAESPQPRQVTFTETDINAFFKQSVKAKNTAWLPAVHFKRAYVNLHPGTIWIGAERSVFGYPLYSSAAYRLEVKDGQFQATNVGGSIGRLPVHPLIMKGAEVFFQKLWTALKPQHELMKRMQRVQVDKGRITLVTRGAAAR